ncbi:MAG: RlmE family RNA methyltransferase [Desulfotalea sp.]
MRKVNDYYARKAKKDKYPARSVYKLEEAQQKFKLIKRGDSILDLGCSPGSWSLYASEIAGETGVVVGVDLQDTSGVARPGGAPIHWICADIREPEMLEAVRKIRPSYRVLISDMAPRTTGNKWADAQSSIELCYQTLELAQILLLNKGNYICKVFQGEDFPRFVDDVKKSFQTVKVVKPKSSRIESREVFVVALNYRRPANKK